MSFFPEALVTASQPGGLGMNVYLNAPPSGSEPIPVAIAGGVTISASSTSEVSVLNWPADQQVSQGASGSAPWKVSGSVRVEGTDTFGNIPATIRQGSDTATVGRSNSQASSGVTGLVALGAEYNPNRAAGNPGTVQLLKVDQSGSLVITGSVRVGGDSVVGQGASGSQAWKVDPIPSETLPTKYIPVRLTDGSDYYNASGGGGVAAIVGLDSGSIPGTYQNIRIARVKQRFDLSGSPMYIGYAPIGTSDFAAGWTIKRIQTDQSGIPTLAEWTGPGTATWSNRTAETYE